MDIDQVLFFFLYRPPTAVGYGRRPSLCFTSQLRFVTLSPDIILQPSRDTCDYLNKRRNIAVCIPTSCIYLNMHRNIYALTHPYM